MSRIRRDVPATYPAFQPKKNLLTANGKPIAILTDVDEDNFEERLKALRRSRDRAVLDRIGEKAKARGVDKLSMKQIDAIIQEARRERRSAG